MFETFDTDRDGTITPEELRNAFASMEMKDTDLVTKVFKTLDVDNDGFLSFSEFAAGVLSIFGDLFEERIQALFRRYDVDGDGALNDEETKKFLKSADMLLKKNPNSKSAAALQDLLKGDTKVKYEEIRDKLFAQSA